MLTEAALKFVNHTLADATWARRRLQPFTGLSACLSLGPLTIPVVIGESGLFSPGKADTLPTVSIHLPADTLLRALADQPSLFSAAQISGTAEFAEALGFVFRNLRWEAEDDLSRLFGDIAARRLLRGGRQIADWHIRRVSNFARNFTEYLTEEVPEIARHSDVARFCTAVNAIEDDCMRLEKRLQIIETR